MFFWAFISGPTLGMPHDDFVQITSASRMLTEAIFTL